MAMIAFKPATLVEAPEMKDLETMQTSSPQQGHGEVAPSKFTPGPWFADDNANVLVGGTRAETIAWVSSPDSFEDADEPAMANARLIAAAPTMLEALSAVLDNLHIYWHADHQPHRESALQDAFDAASAAIRKATGEP